MSGCRRTTSSRIARVYTRTKCIRAVWVTLWLCRDATVVPWSESNAPDSSLWMKSVKDVMKNVSIFISIKRTLSIQGRTTLASSNSHFRDRRSAILFNGYRYVLCSVYLFSLRVHSEFLLFFSRERLKPSVQTAYDFINFLRINTFSEHKNFISPSLLAGREIWIFCEFRFQLIFYAGASRIFKEFLCVYTFEIQVLFILNYNLQLNNLFTLNFYNL